VAKEMLKAMKP